MSIFFHGFSLWCELGMVLHQIVEGSCWKPAPFFINNKIQVGYHFIWTVNVPWEIITYWSLWMKFHCDLQIWLSSADHVHTSCWLLIGFRNYITTCRFVNIQQCSAVNTPHPDPGWGPHQGIMGIWVSPHHTHFPPPHQILLSASTSPPQDKSPC